MKLSTPTLLRPFTIHHPIIQLSNHPVISLQHESEMRLKPKNFSSILSTLTEVNGNADQPNILLTIYNSPFKIHLSNYPAIQLVAPKPERSEREGGPVLRFFLSWAWWKGAIAACSTLCNCFPHF